MGKTVRLLGLVLWFSVFLWLGWSTARSAISKVPSAQVAASLYSSEPKLVTFGRIISRNLFVCAVLVGGAATGGLLTLYQVAVIGLTLGIDMGLSVATFGSSWTMRALAAHAPLELAGFGLAAYTGLSGLGDTMNYITKMELPRTLLVKYIRPFLVAACLITIAALLETWVTPLLL